MLDHSGNVIGVYTASEARKKAEALSLDMVMVSLRTSPITCKAIDFRKRILNRFYDQIVVKSNKQSNKLLIKISLDLPQPRVSKFLQTSTKMK